MALFDFAKRTLTLNVVYFGPRQAGCGTNVRQLHRTHPARDRVELRRMGSEDKKERIWHFTYRPDPAPAVPGFEVRMRVASVPSAQDLGLQREPFLEGVDGVVFVADARANRAEENVAALHDLEACLVRQGADLAGIPLVFQVNQMDAPNARPLARVMEELNPHGAPAFEALARQGKGVVDTHAALRSLVLARLADQLAPNETPVRLVHVTAAARGAAEDRVLEHAAALPQMPGIPRDGSEIVVRPAELQQLRPVQVIRCELRAGRLRLETIMRREDGTVRRLTLLVEPGVDTNTPIPEHDTEPVRTGGTVPSGGLAGERDLPGLTYGVVGALGGIVSGFLLGYLVWG
ncbi:MAG TPA: hypothetical protein PKA64_10330 [Myxococcota bacterium]|nr:hypothetical protein [Myxococcota bacterium]